MKRKFKSRTVRILDRVSIWLVVAIAYVFGVVMQALEPNEQEVPDELGK